MKKSTIYLSLPFVLLSTALASCGQKQDDLTQLNVVVYSAGWGDEWIKDVVAKWEEKNPGYKVDLTAKYEVNNLISKRLASSKNTDDLYISTSSSWKTYAATNKFMALDDLMEEEIDGVKFIDKVSSEYRSDLYFTSANGEKHVYRLPWTNGIGGIYYNAKMFEANGWEVPSTTDELLNLVKNIVSNPVAVEGDETTAVKPFVFSGTNTDYFDYGIFNWWMQLAGYDAVKEFYNYDKLENFDSNNSNSPYHALKEVVSYWRELFASKDNYVSGSLSFSKDQAQNSFFNGRAAMMFNGDWLYNETLNLGSNSNFEVKLMKTPKFSNAKEEDVGYVIGSDQYIAVPATSKKKELAKSFIKEMVSNWSLSNFTNKSHGFLAYNNSDTSSIDKTNTYVASCLETRSLISNKLTDYSSSRKFLDEEIKNAWVESGNRPFLGLLQNESKTVESCFQTIYEAAKVAFKS